MSLLAELPTRSETEHADAARDEAEAPAWPPMDWWEPWQPQIGDRVRIRLSGECLTPVYPKSYGASLGHEYMHHGVPDGVTGVVSDVSKIAFNATREQVAEAHAYYIERGHPYDPPGWLAVAYEYGDNTMEFCSLACLEQWAAAMQKAHKRQREWQERKAS